ncbi:MAG: Sir2 family NAD-dependent protein deacetylase [Deltaproteobacteria bacterium]|nr:Sir2 family NAD-dependent protein deacetylase [Deltaproteobacteria bacterium]MBW2393286.1 Sir2 family NAD-dependent protein deacetylase [Deltaproteobacteria bacterium]
MHDARQPLADEWRRGTRVVVLTGAGISTASGIPDFRSPGGRWSSYQPVPIQDFMASRASREAYWRYKGETWQVIQAAEPNPAHRALVRLAAHDRLNLLVTQNVDGLHARSGFPAGRLIHIHGTDAEVMCLACGSREPREASQQAWEAGEAVPKCRCGEPWKPATISFGQGLVSADLERAFAAARDCDLFVAIGTSLVVSPINEMLPRALDAGAKVAILTASETPFDASATWRFSDPLETILPDLVARMALDS